MEDKLERNPHLTKERADFVFNKIKKYYEQNGYKLVISEVEANRELIGSVLNTGSQLKLNKIFSSSIINLLLDAFEVDGNLNYFDNLFSTYHTNIELRSDRKQYELMQKYFTEREKNPNYKSKTEHLNKDIPIDDTTFEEYTTQPCTKVIKKKTKTTEQIEQDFLNSIEKPTFMLNFNEASFDDEYKNSEEQIQKNSLDNEAIMEDFLNSIKPPSIEQKDAQDTFEQLSFNCSFDENNTENSEPKTKSKKKKNIKTHKQTTMNFDSPEITDDTYYDKLNHISINNTILSKEEPSIEKFIASQKSKDKNKVNQKKEEENRILYKESFIKNGKKVTNTFYKSGGKITEITIDVNKTNKQTKTKNKVSDNKKRVVKNKNQLPKPKPNTAQSPIDNNKQSRPTKNKQLATPKSKKRAKTNHLKIFIVFIFIISLFSISYVYRDFIKTNLLQLTQATISNNTLIQDSSNNQASDIQTSNNQSSNNITIEEDPLDIEEIPIDEKPVYILPSNEREITQDDFSNLSKSEVRFALNEMFARHGWHFNQVGDFYDYFMKQSWYKPDLSLENPLQAEKKMSELEIKNLIIIKAKYDSMR